MHEAIEREQAKAEADWERAVAKLKPLRWGNDTRDPSGKYPLDVILNPRKWTDEISDAWHKSVPDMAAAFAALRALTQGCDDNA
jgi:hypothetical protein